MTCMENLVRSVNLRRSHLRLGEGTLATAVHPRKPIHVRDPRPDTLPKTIPEQLTNGVQPISPWGIPLPAGGTTARPRKIRNPEFTTSTLEGERYEDWKAFFSRMVW